jgi:hypothetical protein
METQARIAKHMIGKARGSREASQENNRADRLRKMNVKQCLQ